MITFVKLLGLFLLAYFGVLCMRKPLDVLIMIAKWPRLIFGKHFELLDSKSILLEALDLLDNDPTQYKERFQFQISMVKLSGVVAIFISIGAGCILALSR